MIGFSLLRITLNSKLKTQWQVKREMVEERKSFVILGPCEALFSCFVNKRLRISFYTEPYEVCRQPCWQGKALS